MNHSVLIRQVNALMLDLHQSAIGTFLPLGGAYKTRSHLDIRRDLVLHRMTRKWYVPDETSSEDRSKRSIQKWLDLEEKISTFSFSPDGDERWHCMRASALLHKWLKPLEKKISSLVGDLDFTAGESFYSMRGLTSVRQKLRNLKHWTVTWEAADEAALLCWTSRSLRTCAWEHLQKTAYDDSAKLLWESKASEQDVFVFLVKTYLFRFVNGARLALVPKDNTIDRAINVEPTFNMLLQRLVGNHLRSVMLRLGNNLNEGQSIHRRRLIDKTLSTIDFSNASDSHILAMFEAMFPKWFVDYILRIRSAMTVIKPLGLEVYNFKLSSMGNGFTFEVMTLLLLALTRVVDQDSTVYGDDVIIITSAAPAFVKACESLGWVVNKDKTFINSPFRESCGGFYHDDIGYLTSFDFYWCESIIDVVTTVNKLRLILDTFEDERLTKLWQDIVDLCPASLKGPVLGLMDKDGFKLVEPRFIEVPNFRRAHQRNKRLTERFTKESKIREAVSSCYQDDVVAIVTGYRLRSKVAKNLLTSKYNDTFDMYSAIYGLTTDQIRNATKCTPVTLYITRDGNVLSSPAVRACAQRA